MPRYTEHQQALTLAVLILEEGNLTATRRTLLALWERAPSRKTIRRWRRRERLPHSAKSEREQQVSSRLHQLRTTLIEMFSDRGMQHFRRLVERVPQKKSVKEVLDEQGVTEKAAWLLSLPTSIEEIAPSQNVL